MIRSRLSARGVGTSLHCCTPCLLQRAMSTRVLPVMANESSRRKTSKLTSSMRGSVSKQTGAKLLFEDLLRAGRVEPYQLGVMLKSCATSAETRQLIARAEASGVEISASAFNFVISRLQMEGRPESEVRAVLDEMDLRGLARTERTQQTLEAGRCEEALSRRRTALLAALLRGGEREREGARALFDSLLSRGLAQ
eukprot:187190-Prymnesium_polylepis.1